MVLCPDGQEAPERPRFLYSEGSGAVEMESRRKDAQRAPVITDPESGMFVKGEHERQFAYEAYTACGRQRNTPCVIRTTEAWLQSHDGSAEICCHGSEKDGNLELK